MCVLHAEGKEFNVDKFLENSSLKPYKTWHKGELGKRKGRFFEDSGFSVDISDEDWNDISNQIVDAENFLNENFNELNRLSETPNVEDIRFDFPYSLRLNENIFTQSEYIPPSFLKIIGRLNIGIEMSLYPLSKDEE